MSFERRLVLNRWLHARFGASSTDDVLDRFNRGDAPPSGESAFLRLLLENDNVDVEQERLRRYDDRILEFQARLAVRRPAFSWKPFQYLALIYSEFLLDEATRDPDALVHTLNAFLSVEQARDPALTQCPPFTRQDLRRLAYFMATGSGKTLVMHANYWQVLHYLRHGARPDALVDRPDGRAEFDNILLVTPTATLSRQHIDELRASGIAASHLSQDADPGGWLFDPPVRVIEIHKLAEEVSGEGVSIALDALGSHNLVFVDEGHKGRGSVAQTWKTRQRRISEGGLLVEYSATFAQAVAAVPRSRRAGLEFEYGKAIVFDYSYRHFHDDGYGKHFEVLNLRADEQDRAHELLVGGLLMYWQQLHLYETGEAALREFNLERPLWVFLGSSVIKAAQRDLADVAIVIAFLRRFIEDRVWAVDRIRRVLAGESGFRSQEADADLFAGRLDHLRGSEPGTLYERILARMFHGGGALEVWELKNADGELALKVSTGTENRGYFGVINVGDARGLARHIEESLGLETLADEFTGSLFDDIDRRDSSVHMLIGSRRFIEGWSSWRVSSMGLLNMGRGEGPQVIQLFGRGVRLKGRGMSLQRTTQRGDVERDASMPPGLRHLETLYITGWNADYIQAFRRMLEEEDLAWEEVLEVRVLDPQIELFVPRTEPGYDVSRETWTLGVDTGPPLKLDRVPRIQALRDGADVVVAAERGVRIDFSDARVAARLDVDRLYADLLLYKQSRRLRGYGNVFVRRDVLLPILERCDLIAPERSAREPASLQRYALDLLQAWLDRFLARREKEAESHRLSPQPLQVREVTAPYRIRGSSAQLRDEIRALIADRDRLEQSGQELLPRLHLEWHLFSPLLLDPRTPREQRSEPRISPPGLKASEQTFVNDLVSHWRDNHEHDRYAGLSIYLLRNLSRTGVGFFRRLGFYPDFLLWLVRPDEPTRLRFIEPHGMHHEGITGLGNANRIEALAELERLSEEPAFREAGIEMRGWIVTETERGKIPGAESLSYTELAEQHRVLHTASRYIETVLAR